MPESTPVDSLGLLGVAGSRLGNPRRIHRHPINPVFYGCPRPDPKPPSPGATDRERPPRLGVGFPLRCLQRLPLAAWLPGSALPDNRYTRGHGPQFLSYCADHPLRRPTVPAGRVRPVSRRSKPISRSLLMGEQPHSWPLLQGQARKRRRLGTKPRGRCELSPATSRLLPG